MRSRMRLVGVMLAALLVSGCGRSYTPDAPTTEGTVKVDVKETGGVPLPISPAENVTFYVKDMGKRLNLL